MAGSLEIKKVDITKLDTDCIVNAANSALAQGSGVCGAIFEAAGAQQLQKACNAYPGCPTGSSVVTPGFHLKAKYIIHAVGPRWAGGDHGEPKQLASCYRMAMKQAAEKGCRSIAFPLISSGIYGYPKKQAWEVALTSILDFQEDSKNPALDVIIAVIDDGAMGLGCSVLKAMKALRSPQSPHLNVGDMLAGRTLDGFYVLQSAAIKTTSSGKPFLSASVSDKTGAVPIVFWDYSGPITPADDGKVVFLTGRIAEFKGSLQLNLEGIRLADDNDSYDVGLLVPVAPIDMDQMYGDILTIVDSIRDPDYASICREFLSRHAQQLRDIPAAKSVHHSFLHGLLMHTGYMLKTAEFLADLYKEVVDRDLLLTGTLLHDFAKREEFTFSALGLVTDYSVKGQLLGHLVMGAQEAAVIARELNIPEAKSILLQHMLLSHHGKPEYGAAMVPMCAESELLAMIDMLDSRMEIYRENLEQVPLGQFSGRIFALDGHRIYRHYDGNP